MTAVIAHYPYHRALEWTVPVSQGPNRGGCFSQMAQKPVSSDKYLFELVRVLEQYHRKVTSSTFTMTITLKQPKDPPREIVYVPPEVLLDLLMELLYVTILAGESPREMKPPVTIQMALQHTEFVAHHSSILIEMIQCLLQPSGDKAPRLSEKNLQRLRDLKEGLAKLNIFLEKVIMYHTFLPTIDRPQIADIRKAINQVQGVLRVMKVEQIQKFFAPYSTTRELQRYQSVDVQDIESGELSERESASDRTLCITQDDVLGSIVGLNRELTKQLEVTPETERDHRTDEYLALEMLDDVYQIVTDESLETVESRFFSLVFNEATAQILSDLVKNIPMKYQQSVLYWAKRFIENKFDYDILLNDDVRPLDPDSGSMNVNTNCRVTDGRELPETVKVATSYAQKSEDIDAFISKVSDDKNVVYFHGTDAESGKSIIGNGIMLGKGNRQQDFSDGYGFYVTENGQTALKWARHGNFAPSAAVIAFKVPTNKLEGFQKLDLTDDMEMWKNIINYNRCGRDRRRFKIPAELKKTLGKADFVVGKECALETTAVWPKKDLAQRSDTQVCIRSDRMADIVGDVRNISVCFFEKGLQF